jgi:hypothetical protein
MITAYAIAKRAGRQILQKMEVGGIDRGDTKRR